MTPDFEWLYKLQKIREKVHEVSDVPMLHINEQEAKKALRLKIERLEEENFRQKALIKKQAQKIFENELLLKQVDLIANPLAKLTKRKP